MVSGGSAQTAKVGTGFSSGLEAQVVDTAGCPVSGVDVEFVAPTSGPSGTFPGAATNATVESDTNGVATAPILTANDVSGSYMVLAEVASTGIEVEFDLTNTTAGVANAIKVSSGNDQSTKVGTQFALPLTVNVVDAFGDPVPGETVDFTVVTTAGAGATFVGGGASATAQTSEAGAASSPLLVAGTAVGLLHRDRQRQRDELVRYVLAQRPGFRAFRHDGGGRFIPDDGTGNRFRRSSGRHGDR